MPSLFATSEAKALDRVFARFGVAASYVSPENVCRIIVNAADESATLGNTPVVSGRVIVEVRASEVAAPVRGSAFTADAVEYRIVSAPKREDPSGLVWTCLCDLQPAA